MYCKNYGKQIPDGAKNCSYCGIDQTYQVICERKRQAMIPLRKSTRKDSQGYSAASVLPALKGFIAFMSEKSEQESLYLLTVGLFGFETIADVIHLVCGNFTDSEGRPRTNWDRN